MDRRIAVLRGINVGGKRSIRMNDLKQIFEQAGFTKVVTYIQSGNVIFNTDKQLGNSELADFIEKAISESYGFEVPVIVRSAVELEKTVKENPFAMDNETDISRLHLTMLKEEPAKEHRMKTESCNFEPDMFSIAGEDIYLLCMGSYSQSKLSTNFFESRLKVPATTRNWKTVLRLLELGKQ